jgi:ATP-dependent 26S proteasome regulatory subunit
LPGVGPQNQTPVHPQKYLKSFLESEAAIMLIAGPPGTGKTTLLRHLIVDFDLSAHVVYDEVLMNTDKVFQNFLFEPNSDILVIEDADTILTSREDSGNKLMSRFLNVSDGLIKLPNKKVVFTTNISDFGRVDPALIRPGRCFDAMRTRQFNLLEAQAAAKAGGLVIPRDRHEYTLAELFSNQQGPAIRKVGF